MQGLIQRIAVVNYNSVKHAWPSYHWWISLQCHKESWHQLHQLEAKLGSCDPVTTNDSLIWYMDQIVMVVTLWCTMSDECLMSPHASPCTRVTISSVSPPSDGWLIDKLARGVVYSWFYCIYAELQPLKSLVCNDKPQRTIACLVFMTRIFYNFVDKQNLFHQTRKIVSKSL